MSTGFQRLRQAAICGASLFAFAAGADERFDHRGAVGLLTGISGEYLSRAVPCEVGTCLVTGPRFDLDLGTTWAVGVNGNELMLLARAILGGASPEGAAIFGYRGYFGQDQLKTFFDLGAAFHLIPTVSAGPRIGFGVQYEVSSVVGFYASIAAQVGLGQATRFDGELNAGVQLRSYLLE